MTFKDAVHQRIKRIRLPIWEPSAYVELPLIPPDKIGAIALVHDSAGDVNIGMWEFDDDTSDEWEPAETF